MWRKAATVVRLRNNACLQTLGRAWGPQMQLVIARGVRKSVDRSSTTVRELCFLLRGRASSRG